MMDYLYGEQEPTEPCPYCGVQCRADFVDVGVGMTQCGPYHCETCGASEIGPHDTSRDLTEAERKNGWYAPGQPPSDKANVVDGKIISYQEMQRFYRVEFVGNPLWEDKDYVEKWRQNIRKEKL